MVATILDAFGLRLSSWIGVISKHFFLILSLSLAIGLSSASLAQSDVDLADLGDLRLPDIQQPLCFGFRDIEDPRALAVCDALDLDQTVKARELSEAWLNEAPSSPAAQFAFAEVLFTIEGNMPRALYHLQRAEELTGYTDLETAFGSGNAQWHYLTLSQLSYVNQLMGDQLQSLLYLDKIEDLYGVDMESFRGWPLIKMKNYDAARESANRVLQTSEDERERARAWNTLCTVELANIQPIESMTACERAISEDEDVDNTANDYDTVYLSNAAEVSLSLLEIDKAEEYLDRATRYLNPQSVADPWIYKLYLTMAQGRFDEAKEALDRMLVWREAQDPIVSVMNRAEHFLVSANFLLLAGYSEDAIRLTSTALNQPDRNGSYSAGDAQKDSVAALVNMAANRSAYQIQLENAASMDWLDSIRTRISASGLLVDAWRAERRAAAIFADFDYLQSRLRPYSPLDVYIPEWLEPEIIALIGSGVMSSVLEEARDNGAFTLNDGYYYSYLSEISALEGDHEDVLAAGAQALSRLPQQEVLLKARVTAHMGHAAWQTGNTSNALNYYESALKQDPSIIRRLELALPVRISGDGSEYSQLVESYLGRSPRFQQNDSGLILEVKSLPDLSICLKNQTLESLSCYTMSVVENQTNKWNAQQLSQLFHTETFGLGYEISKAQRSILLGSSVILSSQNNNDQSQTLNSQLSR